MYSGVCIRTLLDVNGRSMRDDNEDIHTVRTDFLRRNYDLRQHNASFRSALRVGRGYFETIVAFVEAKWSILQEQPIILG